jgi:hypothetical protein
MKRGTSRWIKPENSRLFSSLKKRVALPCVYPRFPRLLRMERTRPKRWQWPRTLYDWCLRTLRLAANLSRMARLHAFARSRSRSLHERTVAGAQSEGCRPSARAGGFSNLPNVWQPLPAHLHERSRTKGNRPASRQHRSQAGNTACHHRPSRTYRGRVRGSAVITPPRYA